jgi:hypothetical protein
MESTCKSKKHADKEKCKQLIDLRDGKMKFLKTMSPEGRIMTWEFSNGTLAHVTIDTGYDVFTDKIRNSITEEIELLKQIYGPPTSIQTVPYQNSFGAKWDCTEATWHMPDDVYIQANEFISNVSHNRDHYVYFATKEFLEAEGLKRTSGTNPYAQKP